jgi:hypothetical protein
MTQQTAVEWLIEELGEYFPHEIGGIHLMVNAAKAMEKEQTKDAYIMGSYDMAAKEFRPEQYYNETYKK